MKKNKKITSDKLSIAISKSKRTLKNTTNIFSIGNVNRQILENQILIMDELQKKII